MIRNIAVENSGSGAAAAEEDDDEDDEDDEEDASACEDDDIGHVMPVIGLMPFMICIMMWLVNASLMKAIAARPTLLIGAIVFSFLRLHIQLNANASCNPRRRFFLSLLFITHGPYSSGSY